MTLNGLKIVVDCAHGASYVVAPKVLWELGAEVIELGTSPNGFNINDQCGSTHPDGLSAAVREHGADLGIALDGDADRLVLADENGQLVDGDQMLGLLASHWKRQNRLGSGTVVATIMSNLGLERFLGSQGLSLHRTKVGDRYVVEAMRASGHTLGGEQSGHIVMTEFATTGDGLLAGLQILTALQECDQPLSSLGRVFEPLPQRLRNCRLNGGRPLEDGEVQRCIEAANDRLKGHGRLLVRPSGTEPLIRVMVEADDETLLTDVLDQVSDCIQRRAGADAAHR